MVSTLLSIISRLIYKTFEKITKAGFNFASRVRHPKYYRAIFRKIQQKSVLHLWKALGRAGLCEASRRDKPASPTLAHEAPAHIILYLHPQPELTINGSSTHTRRSDVCRAECIVMHVCCMIGGNLAFNNIVRREN
jgi:hypothetical protein